MSRDVRRLFPQVERLIRLALICPVPSLITGAIIKESMDRAHLQWTAQTEDMATQQHDAASLNAVAVCHVHQHILDDIDVKELAADFVSWS